MILLVSAVFPPEPVVASFLARDIANRLAGRWKVKVISPRPSRPMGFIFNENGINHDKKYGHIIVNSYTNPKSEIAGRIYESYSFGKHVAGYIRKHRSGIKCIYIKAWPLFAQYLIVREAKKYSIPSILHFQDIYPESLLDKLPFLNKIIVRLLLPVDSYAKRNATRVITISPAMKKYIAESRKLDEEKVLLVYNWQNEESFINDKTDFIQSRKEKTPFTFMFLGSLSKTAAVNVIISAFSGLGHGDARLIIAGDGSEKDNLLSLAGRSRNSAIEFWDAPSGRVPEIQSKADVLIISLRKGASRFAFPSKMIAYMLSQKPVIACVDENSDTAETIRHANCGWIVRPEDTTALSATMKRIISIPREELQKMGGNGFLYAMESFSKEKNLQKIESAVAALLSE